MLKIRLVKSTEFYDSLQQEKDKRWEEVSGTSNLNYLDWYDYLDWYVSENDYPCIYFEGNYGGTLYCPTSDRGRPTRKLPIKFKRKEKKNIVAITHIADVICSELNLKTTVRCYAITREDDKADYQYHICEHKVGNCPHKEAYDDHK